MYDIDRQKKILEILSDGKSHNVFELSEKIFASSATIRRDLIKMENKGLITRTFGAVILNTQKPNNEISFELRETKNLKEKTALCAEAANHLSNNMTIFIDSSSTLLNIVSYLNRYNNITIITNGLFIANEIVSHTTHQLILCGGQVHTSTNSLSGNLALRNITNFHVDLALMSSARYDIEHGFYESTIDVSELKQAMIKNSDKVIMLLDDTKIGHRTLAKICTLDQINYLITNHKFTNDEYEKLGRNKNKIIII